MAPNKRAAQDDLIETAGSSSKRARHIYQYNDEPESSGEDLMSLGAGSDDDDFFGEPKYRKDAPVTQASTKHT